MKTQEEPNTVNMESKNESLKNDQLDETVLNDIYGGKTKKQLWDELYCPNCGSYNVSENGHMTANAMNMICNDCLTTYKCR